MQRATLVVMAAGIGSRFGNGRKQLEPVGPHGELLVDYAIQDALAAGFSKVVFVIRKELESEFRSGIGKRLEGKAEVVYVPQELSDLPTPFQQKFPHRTKPWGTGQAILCCREQVQEPFLVINADDYYGKEAFQKAYTYLTRKRKPGAPIQICMIGYVLQNTLSEHGGVTRGICQVDEAGQLQSITETKNILKTDRGVCAQTAAGEQLLDPSSVVSMNMWGLFPTLFPILEERFKQFLAQCDPEEQEAEFLLPDIFGSMVAEKSLEVQVLDSTDSWLGITYQEDKDAVVQAIDTLVKEGYYS